MATTREMKSDIYIDGLDIVLKEYHNLSTLEMLSQSISGSARVWRGCWTYGKERSTVKYMDQLLLVILLKEILVDEELKNNYGIISHRKRGRIR